MERTELLEKPPVAPKPRVLPPPKTILPSAASKHALNLEVSPPPRHTVKPAVAPKLYLSKSSAPPSESKSLASDSEHQACLQQKSEVLRHVGLLNSRNGPGSELRKQEWDYVIPTCLCVRGKCQECSPKENSRQPIQQGKSVEPCQNNRAEGPKNHISLAQTKPLHVTVTNHGQGPMAPLKDSVQSSSCDQPGQKRDVCNRSPGAVKHVQNFAVAHKSVSSETHAMEKPQGSVGGAHGPPATVIGSPPRTSGQTIINNKHHGHVPGRENGSSPSVVTPVKKPPPLPMRNKPKNNGAEHLDKTEIISGESSTKTRLKVVKLIESTPVSQRERPPITLLKPPAKENISTRGVTETQSDNVVYPRWKTPAAERLHAQNAHHGGLSGHADRKQQSRVEGYSNKKERPDPNPKTITANEVQKKPQGIIPMSVEEVLENNTRPVKGDLPVPPQGSLGDKPIQKVVSHSGNKEPNNSTPDNTKDKRPGTGLKPKAKSFSPADKLQAQKTTFHKKMMELDPQMKRAKNKQTQDCTVVKNEHPLDEDRQGSSNQYETYIQIPEYRSHLVKEQSVDGEDVLEKAKTNYLNQNPSDFVDSLPASNAAIKTPRPNRIQQRQLSNNAENLYEGPDSTGESTPIDERNVYEEMVSSDDTHSEEEIDSDSEVEEDGSSYSDKGQSQNDAKRTKLAHIAREIMSSEKVFVDVLKLLHITFRDTVAKASAQAGKAVIDERTLNQILFSLPQLYELNCNLLRELEDRVANWNERSGVADIFLKKGPYLKMYSSYICEFDKNVALLEEQCRKNPAFAKVVREFESSPCCANLAVKHYMLKPVQRLPQYQLLLSDYVKNLNENSPDYKDTQDALRLVKNVANHANETMRQGDNFQKLIQVQYRLTGHHEIVQPGRVLLKEGTLMKLSRKVMQPRMFFLFNDTLLYTTPLQSGQFKLNNMLSLAGMKVSKPSQEGHQNELNIESVERSFILSASSPTARDEWLEVISTAIDNYTKKMISFSSSKSPEEGDRDGLDNTAHLGSKAPIWIPDLRATMCMICTCEFTLTWRRHHCRACGKVVCQACSTNKYPLEYLKNRLARVCDQCFETLQQNSSGSGILSPNAKPSGGFHFRKQKRIPAALKEVSANTDESSMSGYLERMKPNKKQWKKLWFVIKNKVLYTYAASEDVAALQSLPLLGFSLKEDNTESSQQFRLYHKDKLFYIFKTDDTHIYHRWMEAFGEAMVL
ncbi:uncharacterized protein [Salminus brasiliensis]|uniref:uncharacterized protein isoform X2 n=1 Tax=Salminus brasiliensis TaxID=930266 RepID=UPI003B8334D3